VDSLPRGLKSTFSLQRQSTATAYHSLPVTSVLRAVVDDLLSIGKLGSYAFNSAAVYVRVCAQEGLLI